MDQSREASSDAAGRVAAEAGVRTRRTKRALEVRP
jgi:hypothetical protein